MFAECFLQWQEKLACEKLTHILQCKTGDKKQQKQV